MSSKVDEYTFVWSRSDPPVRNVSKPERGTLYHARKIEDGEPSSRSLCGNALNWSETVQEKPVKSCRLCSDRIVAYRTKRRHMGGIPIGQA